MPQSIPCFMSTFQATLFTIVNCISTKSKINKIQIQLRSKEMDKL